MSRYDPQFDMVVDVTTYDTTTAKDVRTQPWTCRATPKRIYSPGGATFDRASGAWIVAAKHIPSIRFVYRAHPETLRPQEQPTVLQSTAR